MYTGVGALGGGFAGLTTLERGGPGAASTEGGSLGLSRKVGKGNAARHRAAAGGGLYLPPPHLSASTTVIRATSVSYERVGDLQWVVRVALLERGCMVSQKSGRRGMAKHHRRRRWFCAEDGRPNKAQKKDPAGGLPKCYAHGATLVLRTVADCANQARGARAEEADSLGPAGRRCLAHSPGLVDLTADSVRIIKFDVHRLGTYWVESLRLW